MAELGQSHFSRVQHHAPRASQFGDKDFTDGCRISFKHFPQTDPGQNTAGTVAESQGTVIVAGLLNCLVGHGLDHFNVITQRCQCYGQTGSGQAAANDGDIAIHDDINSSISEEVLQISEVRISASDRVTATLSSIRIPIPRQALSTAVAFAGI